MFPLCTEVRHSSLPRACEMLGHGAASEPAVFTPGEPGLGGLQAVRTMLLSSQSLFILCCQLLFFYFSGFFLNFCEVKQVKKGALPPAEPHMFMCVGLNPNARQFGFIMCKFKHEIGSAEALEGHG